MVKCQPATHSIFHPPLHPGWVVWNKTPSRISASPAFPLMLIHRHSTLLALFLCSTQTKHSLMYRNTPILNLSTADVRGEVIKSSRRQQVITQRKRCPTHVSWKLRHIGMECHHGETFQPYNSWLLVRTNYLKSWMGTVADHSETEPSLYFSGFLCQANIMGVSLWDNNPQHNLWHTETPGKPRQAVQANLLCPQTGWQCIFYLLCSHFLAQQKPLQPLSYVNTSRAHISVLQSSSVFTCLLGFFYLVVLQHFTAPSAEAGNGILPCTALILSLPCSENLKQHKEPGLRPPVPFSRSLCWSLGIPPAPSMFSF